MTASSSRGRGGSVDRGGRTRSGRPGVHYRGGFDDVGDGPRVETQPFPVNVLFDLGADFVCKRLNCEFCHSRCAPEHLIDLQMSGVGQNVTAR